MRESRRSGAGRFSAVVLVASVLVAASAAATDRVRLEAASRPRIVNGITTQAFPTAAALLWSGGVPITPANAGMQCSATLIGCRTVLTAAHCVAGDPIPGHYLVYLQHAGTVAVSGVAVHPSYSFPTADVAVLTLAAPVTGIAPSPINLVDPAPFIPTDGIIVGFGQTRGGAADYGIKRAGVVETLSCSAATGGNDSKLVCWDFVNPVGPPGTDSNTCNGDSGGPLFLDLGAGYRVAGVTSGGTNAFCLPTDHSYDANVATYSPFILAALAGDSTAVCGGLPPVGDAQVTVAELAGALDGGHLSDSYVVPVAAGANAVRFALNGEDNGGFDLDMYVKAGPGASPANFDCKAEGASVFGGCVFDLPGAASYSVFLLRTAGEGDYQLTATTFGGAPPVCGNGSREFNEECDGADDELCSGLCEPDCGCPTPVCGNDVREQGEMCDGTDAAACPGACGAGCTCPPPCQVGGMYPVRLRTTPQRLRFRGTLSNFFGQFDGEDPRDGFRLVLTQGAAAVTVDIPPNDPGWAKSDPLRRRFKWRGSLGGITRVKVIDRPSKGVIKLLVSGKDVAGTAGIDDDVAVDAALTIGQQCVEQSF